MKKSTAELLEMLKKSSLEAYLNSNDSELIKEPLCAYLNAVMKEKNLTKAEVIKKSYIFNIYAYQIFSGMKFPSRDKLIALCFGMDLTVDETQTLLKYAGYAMLYPRNTRDSIIISALKNHDSVVNCNITLDKFGYSPI